MALLNHQLTLWELSFRWAGYDPDRVWIRIPLAARDNFRTLLNAILHAHLPCDTLLLDRTMAESEIGPEYSLRFHLHQIEECIAGHAFDRKLLKWALIDRWAMHSWCEAQGVPLPEFWFPADWHDEYQWPDDSEDDDAPEGESLEQKQLRIDSRHRAKMACQQVAMVIWRKEPTLEIKQLANRKEIQHYAGGDQYQIETIQDWIAEFDPRDPSKKRGRKKKQ